MRARVTSAGAGGGWVIELEPEQDEDKKMIQGVHQAMIAPHYVVASPFAYMSPVLRLVMYKQGNSRDD